jgi:predicted alpha-1,2-mannosidase
MKNRLLLATVIFLFASCDDSNTRYVNPFAGAAELGHCMPGACRPFGMIQVGPQSGNWSWDYTGGYQYRDTTLQGFSQTRINGTGCPDLGDLLLLPFTGEVNRTQYVSGYSKERQTAEPGYYSVYLDDFGIEAEMTAAPHVSIQRYRFDDPREANVMIDFQNGITGDMNSFHKFVQESVQVFESPTVITGCARTKMWVERDYYYMIEFSRPYTTRQELPRRREDEKAPRWVLGFDLGEDEELCVKIALSSVSIAGAKENMKREVPGWDFEAVKKAARGEWDELLSRVEIEGTREQKNIFYSAMYRLFIQPNNIADAGGEPFYSTLSLWDTYRAAHPLYTLLAPEKVDGFVNSMLHQRDLQGFLPIWALWGVENYCMIGNHSVPVIVDAYLKGFRGFDAERAWEAVKTSLTTPLPKTDWTIYDRYGYFPYDLVVNESVSRTLECAYDDHCAALFAKALGKNEDYEFFSRRSQYYRNVFDHDTKMMRARDTEGKWRTPFDKFVISHDSTSGGDYTEGNAWQYTWHVQHDVEGLVELMGGGDYFTAKLDTLFVLEHEARNAGFSKDVSGLIGQYAHGNEPSHHVAYMYALAGKPHRTQELVNLICKTKYLDGVDGLCGNDDCGQMSAWYIFSVLGFYPVDPCGGEYVLGAPQLPRATIALEGGKKFTVEAVDYSPDNIYVRRVELNGKEYDGITIDHSDIAQGGSLKFYMSDKYEKNDE